MDQDIKKLIDDAKSATLAGKAVNRDALKKFLDLDPLSEETEYLGAAARDIARSIGNKGKDLECNRSGLPALHNELRVLFIR